MVHNFFILQHVILWMVLEAVPFSCRCPTLLSSTVQVANQPTCQEITTEMFAITCPIWWANYQSSTVDPVRVNHWLSFTQLLLKLYERTLYLNITTDIHEHCTYRKYTVGRIRSGYRSVFVAIQLWPVGPSSIFQSLLFSSHHPFKH